MRHRDLDYAARRESAVSVVARAALASAAGVWALDRVDNWLYGLESAATHRRTIANRPEGADPATLMVRRTRRAVGRRLGRTIGAGGDARAATAVHYGLGILPAVMFGLLRRRLPWLGAGHGVPFGATFFVLEDKLGNTALRTGGKPSGYPWQAHARGLAAHATFGVVVEALLRATDGR